jgi:hypothetical protein
MKSIVAEMTPPPEALSESHANGIASESNAFLFRLVSQSLRKTAQCGLEKNYGRAIEQQTAVNALPVLFQANYEKFI